jgi:hypothetical protein
MIQSRSYTEAWLDSVCRMRNSPDGLKCCRRVVAGGAFLLLPCVGVVETVARTVFALLILPCDARKSGDMTFSALMACAGCSNSIICFFENLALREQVTGW